VPFSLSAVGFPVLPPGHSGAPFEKYVLPPFPGFPLCSFFFKTLKAPPTRRPSSRLNPLSLFLSKQVVIQSVPSKVTLWDVLRPCFEFFLFPGSSDRDQAVSFLFSESFLSLTPMFFFRETPFCRFGCLCSFFPQIGCDTFSLLLARICS